MLVVVDDEPTLDDEAGFKLSTLLEGAGTTTGCDLAAGAGIVGLDIDAIGLSIDTF